MTQQTQSDQLCINTLRTLSIDVVQQASSGHPGIPIDTAPTAYCLWQRFLRYDPRDPEWLNLDRFVFSAGHATLLYSHLYLTGVKTTSLHYDKTDRQVIALDELERFRQTANRCTGHHAYGRTSSVKTAISPVSNCLSNNVHTLCSDGDLMKSISSEAASLTRHLKLVDRCWIQDDNRTAIKRSIDVAFSEDAATRFSALGWHVDDVNDLRLPTHAHVSFLHISNRLTHRRNGMRPWHAQLRLAGARQGRCAAPRIRTRTGLAAARERVAHHAGKGSSK